MQPTRNDALKTDSLGRRRQQRVQGGWAVPLFQGDQLEKQSKCGSHQNAPKTSSTYLAHQVSAAESPFQTAPGGVDADSVGQVSAGTPRQKLSPACRYIQSKMKSEIPRNFSWIEPDLLCGLGYPDRTEHIQYLADHNVGILVNLTQDRTPPTHLFPDMKMIRIGVKDFGPPSLDQIHEFLAIVHQAKHIQKAVAVHCNMGKGRTGTFFACYLLAHHKMDASSAIAHLRRSRPGSVQTAKQKDIVHAFQEELRTRDPAVT